MLNFRIYLHLLLNSQFTEGRDETGHCKGSQDKREIASAEKTFRNERADCVILSSFLHAVLRPHLP